jgi:hypothetical protein
MKDLLYIEDANQSFIPGTKLVNFTKLRLMADIIEKIQNFQPMVRVCDQFLTGLVAADPLDSGSCLPPLSLYSTTSSILSFSRRATCTNSPWSASQKRNPRQPRPRDLPA